MHPRPFSHPVRRGASRSIAAVALSVAAFGLHGPDAFAAAEPRAAGPEHAPALAVGARKPPNGGAQAGRPPSAKHNVPRPGSNGGLDGQNQDRLLLQEP